jgi:radical SAM superfamily enzyme YgiQ (UPF0313 family)
MDYSGLTATPPLGLLSAASVICREMEVRIVDQRAGGNWRDCLAKSIDAQTVAVGVTSMTGSMILYALDMAREARRHTKAPIIWGGIHTSLVPQQTAEHELADYAVEGEGDMALAELVRRIAAGADTAGIPGVWSKVNGKVACTPRAQLLDMDTLPPTPYHLIDAEQYIQIYQGQRALFYQTSRGCPCRCSYCYNLTFNKGRWRSRSAEKILEEMAELKKRYKLEVMYIWDDNFFIDTKRARTLLAGMKELGLRCMLHGADVESLARMSDSDLDFLEEVGVDTLAIGVESAVDRVRTEVLNKRGGIDLVRAQLERFKGRSIHVGCFFILGLPTETAEEIKKTIMFAMDTLDMGPNFHIPQFFNFAPYPGTAIFDRLQKQGVLFPRKLEEWGKWEWDYSMIHDANPKIKDLLARITVMGKYIDSNKDPFLTMDPLRRVVARIYAPVARARLRSGILWPMPELWMSRMQKKLTLRFREFGAVAGGRLRGAAVVPQKSES